MRIFEAVVDTNFVRDARASYASKQNKLTYELIALQLDPNRRNGESRWTMDGGVEEKEGGSEAGRRK